MTVPGQFRRAMLQSAAAVLVGGLAGCTGDGTGDADTPTPTKEPEIGGATLDYLVRNDDDTTHPLSVKIENSNGTVVHERSDSEFKPGEQLGATAAGYDPKEGPFPITIGLKSLSTTIEWKADECPQFDLLVAVTSDGQLEVEREECIK